MDNMLKSIYKNTLFIKKVHKPLLTLINKAVILSASIVACLSLLAHADGAFEVDTQQEEQQIPSFSLEELIVTAQKRIETLGDVPVSVAAVSGTKLNDMSIDTIAELTVFVPNIHFTETGLSTQVRIRGLGSDNSQGFEQSVGMYVDGVYFGRPRLFRAPMMDMARAEVLRGPQGILFGKNSISGALNLSTARPTDEFEGYLSLAHEFEFDTNVAELVLSGPLMQNLNARLALRDVNDNGFVYNQHKGEDEAERDEQAVRLSLAWEMSDRWQSYFKYERNTFESIGRSIEVTQDIPLSSSPSGLTFQQILTTQLGQADFDSNFDFVRAADAEEYSDNKVENGQIEILHQHETFDITSITGLVAFDYDENCDCDFIPSKILQLNLFEDFEQISQEIRFTSTTEGKLEWIGGLYYQYYDQFYGDQFDVESDNLLPSLNPNFLAIADTGVRREFNQVSRAWALFAQASYTLSERWHLTLGARYTEEEKEADKRIDIVNAGTANPTSDPTAPVVYLNAFGIETNQALSGPDPGNPSSFIPLAYAGHNVAKSRDESAFIPLVTVEYDFDDDSKSYLTYTEGFKAGGFDPRSNTVGLLATPDVGGLPMETEGERYRFFEFDNEDAKAIELGYKTRFADGRGELNVAVFNTEYKNLQISQFDGRVGFNVGNAKKTAIAGIELDGRWLFTPNLTASYGLSYLDFDYKDFKNGNCHAGQTPDGIDVTGDGIIDTCDYTGKRGVYTPEWTMNVALDHTYPINNTMTLFSLFDWQYVDEQQVHVNLDPSGMIDNYNMFSFRVGLEMASWSIALIGKNLLDEKVSSFTGNVPLSDTLFSTNTHYSFVRRPRTLALEARLLF